MKEAGAIEIVGLHVITTMGMPAQARITLNINGSTVAAQESGNGPIAAIFTAIRELVPHDGVGFQDYEVHNVGANPDSLASATVKLATSSRSIVCTCEHVDTLLASAQAYIGALSEIFVTA